MNSINFKKILIFLVLICFTSSCGTNTAQTYSREFFAMDTVIYIQLSAESEKDANAAFYAAEQEFLRVESLTTAYENNLADPMISDIIRVNRAEGSECSVSDEVYSLLEQALSVSEQCGGAFDIAMGNMIELWNIKGGGYLPSKDEIAKTLASCGNDKVRLQNDNKVLLNDGVQLDLGGIAKGYAVDCIGDKLRELGIESALINAGGNVLAIGAKPDGSAWQIGVRTPDGSGNVAAVLALKDAAAVTSAIDQRYFTGSDGKHYHHILDPESGYPATLCRSVTVICDNSTMADLLSTAVFVLGEAGAAEYYEKFPTFELLMIDADSEIIVSPGMEELLVKDNQEDL